MNETLYQVIQQKVRMLRKAPKQISFDTRSNFEKLVIDKIRDTEEIDIIKWLQTERSDEIARFFLWHLLAYAKRCAEAYNSSIRILDAHQSLPIFIGEFIIPASSSGWDFLSKIEPTAISDASFKSVIQDREGFRAKIEDSGSLSKSQPNVLLNALYEMLLTESFDNPLDYISNNYATAAACSTLQHIFKNVIPSIKNWESSEQRHLFKINKGKKAFRVDNVKFSLAKIVSTDMGLIVHIDVEIPKNYFTCSNYIAKLYGDYEVRYGRENVFMVCHDIFTGSSSFRGHAYILTMYCYPKLPPNFTNLLQLQLTQNKLEAWIPDGNNIVKFDEKKLASIQWDLVLG